MTIRLGINGFGRIGRAVLRAALSDQNKNIEVVHINDLVDPHTMKHLLKYDSVHGKLPHEVEVTDNLMKVGGQNISLSARRSPTELPWEEKKCLLEIFFT